MDIGQPQKYHQLGLREKCAKGTEHDRFKEHMKKNFQRLHEYMYKMLKA